jgi:hypothetical protein
MRTFGLNLRCRLLHELSLFCVEFSPCNVLRRGPVQAEWITAFITVVEIGEKNIRSIMYAFDQGHPKVSRLFRTLAAVLHHGAC